MKRKPKSSGKATRYDFITLHGDFTDKAYRRVFAVARREGIRVIGHAPRNLGVGPMLEVKQDAVAHIEEYLYAYFRFQETGHWKKLDDSVAEAKIRDLSAATSRARTADISTRSVYKGIGEQIESLDAVLRRPEVRLVANSVQAGWRWLPTDNTYR